MCSDLREEIAINDDLLTPITRSRKYPVVGRERGYVIFDISTTEQRMLVNFREEDIMTINQAAPETDTPPAPPIPPPANGNLPAWVNYDGEAYRVVGEGAEPGTYQLTGFATVNVPNAPVANCTPVEGAPTVELLLAEARAMRRQNERIGERIESLTKETEMWQRERDRFKRQLGDAKAEAQQARQDKAAAIEAGKRHKDALKESRAEVAALEAKNAALKSEKAVIQNSIEPTMAITLERDDTINELRGELKTTREALFLAQHKIKTELPVNGGGGEIKSYEIQYELDGKPADIGAEELDSYLNDGWQIGFEGIAIHDNTPIKFIRLWRYQTIAIEEPTPETKAEVIAVAEKIIETANAIESMEVAA